MLVICRCLFGSSGGAGDDEKLKYYDIPPIAGDGLPLISTDLLHVPPKKAEPQPELDRVQDGEEPEIEPDHQPEQTGAEEFHPDNEILVEKPPSDETVAAEPQPIEEPQESKVFEPQEPVAEPQTQDLSAFFGLRKTDRRNLYKCTEILGSESCDSMVTGMSEAVTEWSWTRKHQRQKVIEKETLANRRFPPPIPRYVGRPCQFMKIKRGDGRVTMSLVQMDRLPEQMLVKRDDKQIKMQLMTYVGDTAINNDAEASTSASTSEPVAETGSYKKDETGTDKWDSSEKRELAVAA